MTAQLRLTPLGTNGFIPTYGRHTMSFLVEGGEAPLLLDAGTGLARLVVPPLAERLAAAPAIDVLLTHYHLDHTVGLSYLTAFARGKSVRIHAPEEPLVDARAHEALLRLVSPPLFPLRLADLPMDLEVVPYAGAELTAAGLHLRVRRQRHAGGSVGVVVGGRLAYLTDTEREEPDPAFLAGVQVLLHDTWVFEAEVAAGEPRHGHASVEEVAGLAAAIGVGTLMPVHHRPDRDEAGLQAVVARLEELCAAEVVLPIEGRTYTV